MRIAFFPSMSLRNINSGMLLLCVLTGCTPHTNDAVHITQADHRVQSPSIVDKGPAPAHYETPADAEWDQVSLPHVVPRPISGSNINVANTVWQTHWYRFRWQSKRASGGALAVYIPRRHLGEGQFDIYVDGIHVDGDDEAVWNRPQLILLPPKGAQGDREILIALSMEPAYGGALSSVWVGPVVELQWRYDWRRFLQIGVPQASSVGFFVFGTLAFLFWLRRRESSYLLFGLLAPVYCLRTLHFYVQPYGFVAGQLLWWLTVNSLAWLQVLVYLFAVTLHGQRFPRAERIMIGIVATASLVSLLGVIFQVQIVGLSPVLYLVQMGVSVAAIGYTTVGSIRSRLPLALVLSAMLWLLLLMGAHDWLLQNWRISVESIYLLPYGSILVLGVALYAIFQRYINAVNEADKLNASLEARLTKRSQELEESHRKLRAIEHEQSIVGERQRLMREMHDGLGSSLMSSLVMVEQGKLDSTQIATVLRESIDDLKLTIDSLEPMGEDLLTLLGTLRYRLGKRLEVAGIKLEWQVEETPPLPWLNPTASLQILRILQETLTNVLKHAHATTIRVETGFDATHVWIRLTDNGHGFDVVTARQRSDRGRGLQNLERRAASMSGTVQIESRPGTTTVTLQLPRG
jgi:signal transduction histidine kinase